MSPFNRLLLVIKQTAFDAYTAQERMARAAGRVLTYDNLRMGRLKERHDTHMFQVERITKMLQERGVRGRKGTKKHTSAMYGAGISSYRGTRWDGGKKNASDHAVLV